MNVWLELASVLVSVLLGCLFFDDMFCFSCLGGFELFGRGLAECPRLPERLILGFCGLGLFGNLVVHSYRFMNCWDLIFLLGG